MREKRKHLIPFNIQFFAEGGNEGGSEAGEGGEGTQQGGDAGSGEGTQQNQKTFTQEEVNRMMSREKRDGKKSVLNSLGFKTEDEAKNAVKLLNALLDSQKTTEDKANDKAKGAEADKDEAVRRAEAAENKLACVMAGVAKDSVDDVLAIALLKVSSEKTLDKVLEGMKKESRYASFFASDGQGSSGTGHNPNSGGSGSNGKDGPGSFGKMVAEAFSEPKSKKSSFFTEE